MSCDEYLFVKDQLDYAIEQKMKDTRDNIDVYKNVRKRWMPKLDEHINFDNIIDIVEGVVTVNAKY